MSRRTDSKKKRWKAGNFKKNEAGGLPLVPVVLAIVIAFVMIYIGIYITGTIGDEAENDFGGTWRTRSAAANRSINAMNNTSDNFDSGLNILNIAILITIFAATIGALLMFTKYK